MKEFIKDWKLKLRYGKITTPFIHYAVIAEGDSRQLDEEYNCPKGNAFMGMKIWAESTEEAADLFQKVGKKIGFKIKGNLEIYETAPQEPPSENPSAYGINFSPFP